MTGARGNDPVASVAWIRRFVELLLEVHTGHRPRRHLRPLVHPELYTRLGQSPRTSTAIVVRSIRLQSIGKVHESAVVLTHRGADGHEWASCLAVSLRLVEGTWLVTEANAPGVPEQQPFEESALPCPSPKWADLAVFDRIEPQPSPRWQVPAGWRRPAEAA